MPEKSDTLSVNNAIFRFLFLCILSLSWVVGASATSLEDLDAIMQKAGSVKGFLADPKIQQEYYDALSSYYGNDTLPKASYEAMLSQLKFTTEAIPELGDRLWETNNLGEKMEFTPAAKSSGYDLKQYQWDDYLIKLKVKLSDDSQALSKLDPAERNKQIKNIIAEKSKMVEEFETQLKTANKAEKANLSKTFYQQTLANDKELKTLSSYFLLQRLEENETKQLLNSQSADLILFAWENLAKKERVDRLGFEIPEKLKSPIAANALPKLETPEKKVIDGKPAETNLFKATVAKSTDGNLYAVGAKSAQPIQFKPVPRRIHGIWKGIPLNECVGGNCQSLHSLTPERWASVALNKAQLLNMEQGNSYLGFVYLAPVEINGKTYAATEFGARSMNNIFSVKDGEKIKTGNLYNTFIEKYKLPEDWKGYVVGDSDAIANSGVIRKVQSSAIYLMGERVGAKKDVNIADPLSKEIIRVSSENFNTGRYASGYSGKMIFETVVAQTKEVYKLDPKWSRLDKNFTNPTKIFYAVKSNNAKALRLYLNSSLTEELRRDQSSKLAIGLLEKFEQEKIKIPQKLLMPMLNEEFQKSDQFKVALSKYLKFDDSEFPAMITRSISNNFSNWSPSWLTDEQFAQEVKRSPVFAQYFSQKVRKTFAENKDLFEEVWKAYLGSAGTPLEESYLRLIVPSVFYHFSATKKEIPIQVLQKILIEHRNDIKEPTREALAVYLEHENRDLGKELNSGIEEIFDGWMPKHVSDEAIWHDIKNNPRKLAIYPRLTHEYFQRNQQHVNEAWDLYLKSAGTKNSDLYYKLLKVRIYSAEQDQYKLYQQALVDKVLELPKYDPESEVAKSIHRFSGYVIENKNVKEIPEGFILAYLKGLDLNSDIDPKFLKEILELKAEYKPIMIESLFKAAERLQSPVDKYGLYAVMHLFTQVGLKQDVVDLYLTKIKGGYHFHNPEFAKQFLQFAGEKSVPNLSKVVSSILPRVQAEAQAPMPPLPNCARLYEML